MIASTRAIKEVRKRNIKKDIKLMKKKRSEYAEKNGDDGVDVITEAAVKNTENIDSSRGSLWTIVYISFGLGVAGVLGYRYAAFVKLMHENDMWFSQISELEREISFRTESGLYYSYYKQLVKAPSFIQGLRDLCYDNATESIRTINIIERFNIFQEIALAGLYKWILPQVQPIYFYIDTVFGLQALYVIALFGSAWLLSDSLLPGVLATAFFVFNWIDATRVTVAIPLRESFALPFIAIQICSTLVYLKHHDFGQLNKMVTMGMVFVSSLLVALTWQFAQFVFLLQGFALFGLQTMAVVSTTKVHCLMLCQAVALLVVYVLQFFNTMLLGSLYISFTIAATIVFIVQGYQNFRGSTGVRVLARFIFSIVAVLLLTVVVHTVIKRLLHIDEDEHVFKFITAKLGLTPITQLRDFDALIYLCEPAFSLQPLDTYKRLLVNFLLQCYYTVTIVLLVQLLLNFYHLITSCSMESEFQPCVRPHYAYIVILGVFFSILAATTLRFKVLCVPYMCVLAAAGISDHTLWSSVLRHIRISGKLAEVVRFVIITLFIVGLAYKEIPKLQEQAKELREFYDPDTVDLMNWINSDTAPDAVFAGSMQLLAGVKLCTGRTITNHPHFENKLLRERTVQVYQMYAKRSPQDVYNILKSLGTNYIILEDSICIIRPNPNSPYCRLPDQLDLVNGHALDEVVSARIPGLLPADWPRFCDSIRFNRPEYTNHFKLVFSNNTFRVYQVK